MSVQADLTLRAPDKTPYSVPYGLPRFYDEQDLRIILIHGFRNSESEAMESYERFRTYLASFDLYIATKLFSLVWPGDAFGMNPARYFDYNVQNALACGLALANFLDGRIAREGPRCQFIIIAHSLGCRLTAEMMKELSRLNPSACSRFKLIFMAGAVPVGDVQNNSKYGASLAAAGYVANFFSPDDEVLSGWFPLGEMGGGRWDWEAIGLNGQPLTFGWSQRQHMEGFRHGDYWQKRSAAEFVARILGVAVPNAIAANVPLNFRPPEFIPG